MDGRVRWFLGLARNSGGYSLPMIGTPCEVPEPRKIKEKAMMSAPMFNQSNSLSKYHYANKSAYSRPATATPGGLGISPVSHFQTRHLSTAPTPSINRTSSFIQVCSQTHTCQSQ